MGMLKMLGLKGRSEPYVTEDELKLMLRGAELSGAIEEEEQDMIENVLEIKETYVREVMTPLVDVVAIDVSATLIDFKHLWETHQYSRVPVFEERIDNIVGIAYAMDMIEYVEKVEKLKESTVGEIAHMPTYFVPDSMSVWNLLREFRIRKVHMAVVLNEYGGTIGIATLEDVVEEIVGEIFDENDSKLTGKHTSPPLPRLHGLHDHSEKFGGGRGSMKRSVNIAEEIQKKTGYIIMQEDGTFDVDANTSIDQLSEELNVKIPEGHQYETVSGFICESFGNIPEEGQKTFVVLEKANHEDNEEYNESESDHHDEKEKEKEKFQTFEIEILEASERKVGRVLFKPIRNRNTDTEAKGLNRLVSAKVVKRKKQIVDVGEVDRRTTSSEDTAEESPDESSYQMRLQDSLLSSSELPNFQETSTSSQ
ncbi:putative DUF21 domain-containing protein [Platanthera guangdongensis]|uniref:DUF21 domain-containing protein n=1 Tax=Platanthera guangdongensis TaxID=2320717 RepID=A0ABR2MZA2_9ASPA